MIRSMSDISSETGKWSDEDWRRELRSWGNWELLDAWHSVRRHNPFAYISHERNREEVETFRHAEHCMYGELMERMGGR